LKAEDVDGMPNDELWSLHLEISAELQKRITARIDELEQCLRKLQANPLNRRRGSNVDERKKAA